jgi:hypothetical protein
MKKEKPYARPPMQSLAPPISSLAMLQNIEKIAREVQFFSSLLGISIAGFVQVAFF